MRDKQPFVIARPTRRVTEREVGYVVDADTIYGEWSGERWEDVPPKARLYTSNLANVRERYERGELVARRWRHGGRRTYGKITSFIWTNPRTGRPHTIYNLGAKLGTDNAHERFVAILEFADWARELGANIGSLGSTLSSIAGTVVERPHYFREADCPVERFARGSRIERVAWPGEYGESTLYDIANAYVSKLAPLGLPRTLRHHKAGRHERIPEVPIGFAHAVVIVPPMFLGPLPDTSLRSFGLRFPTDDAMDGYWTLDELRAAEAVGCDVILHEYWTGSYFMYPFEGFGELLKEARTTLSTRARKLVKLGSQKFVGTYATTGKQLRSYYVDGVERIEEVGGMLRPTSLGIHAQVTGAVRAQLYQEGVIPYGEQVLSIHTDGIVVEERFDKLPERGTGMGIQPGDWDTKHEMKRLLYINPARYAWEDYAGNRHYCVAGTPEERVEQTWYRWEHGYAYRDVEGGRIPGSKSGRRFVRRSIRDVSVPIL